MSTEVADRARFDGIRYAQCWEDADILMQALAIQPGDVCVGIGSAGENCLSKLCFDPKVVIAVDMNPAQLACIELRVAAFKRLTHEQLLQLVGSRPCADRWALFEKCGPELSAQVNQFWTQNPDWQAHGIGSSGKFERYLKLFAKYVIPLVHGNKRVERLLDGGDGDTCRAFYDERWNTWRWRLLFRFFFSRFMMGRLGRDPAFFDFVEGSVADRILDRTQHALRELNPGENPYLHWILRGTHGRALPHALRPENFDTIRSNLDRFEWRLATLESLLDEYGESSVDRFNLSDIFEYMSPNGSEETLGRIIAAGRTGGRMAYWNMLASRRCPEAWSGRRIRPLRQLGDDLLLQDKAFFYSAFVVEEFV